MRATRNSFTCGAGSRAGNISFEYPSPPHRIVLQIIHDRFPVFRVGNSWNSFVGSVSLREQEKHIRQSSRNDKRSRLGSLLRVARGASNVREHGPAGRDEIKRRIPSSRSHVQLICALARRREPTTDASEHGYLSSRRANRSSSARGAMAPSRRLSRSVPCRFARPIDSLCSRGLTWRQHPAQVQRQFDDREKPHCSTRTRAGGERRRTATKTLWRARSECPRTRSRVRLNSKQARAR